MENFNWSQFSKRIFINTDLKTVYNAFTKSEELEKWFLSKALFFSKENEKLSSTENIVSESVYNTNLISKHVIKVI